MQLWVRRYPVRQGLLAFSEASVREILPYGAISLPKGTRDPLISRFCRYFLQRVPFMSLLWNLTLCGFSRWDLLTIMIIYII